jgi:hypothetical protein
LASWYLLHFLDRWVVCWRNFPWTIKIIFELHYVVGSKVFLLKTHLGLFSFTFTSYNAKISSLFTIPSQFVFLFDLLCMYVSVNYWAIWLGFAIFSKSSWFWNLFMSSWRL